MEEELETQFVAVKGVVYEPGEWLDPGWRSIKDQLPSRLNPGAKSGWGRLRGRGVILDQREVYLAEQDRMRRNESTRFVFLIEEARRAEAENDTQMMDPSTRRRKGGQMKTKQLNKKSYTC